MDPWKLIDWLGLIVGLVFVARLTQSSHRNALDIALAIPAGIFAFWSAYSITKAGAKRT